MCFVYIVDKNRSVNKIGKIDKDDILWTYLSKHIKEVADTTTSL